MYRRLCVRANQRWPGPESPRYSGCNEVLRPQFRQEVKTVPVGKKRLDNWRLPQPIRRCGFGQTVSAVGRVIFSEWCRTGTSAQYAAVRPRPQEAAFAESPGRAADFGTADRSRNGTGTRSYLAAGSELPSADCSLDTET